ncbi:RnfABCDGE type electron transport complex subunit D [Patescibacteria group bacterium]|nr:RnfABCDGE type electron transport complex subunit D [Patescibacteria group bacterium]
MVNFKSIKTQLIIFLCAFALYLSFKDKDAIFLLAILIAVISAIGIESLILFLKNKKITVTGSSVISGLIIGYVLSFDNPWWIFILASALAICSKYLIRANKKHLFNPAAFGIFLTLILFGASTQWRGAYLWHILLPFGLYFAYKVRKFKVLIGYGLAALGLFGVQALLQRTPLLNIFGYLSYFYIFIMVIEPKTMPLKPKGQLIFGIGIAVLIFILTEAGARFDAELASLLLMNSFVPLLNKLR